MAEVSNARTARNDWLRALQYKKKLDEDPGKTLLTTLNENLEHTGPYPALTDEIETLSYRELVDRANSYARWTLKQDLALGEAVCLLMPNCVNYVAIWLGITEVGCAAALVNTNLVGLSLAQSILAARSRCVIVDVTLLDAVVSAMAMLPPEVRIWVHGAGGRHEFPRLDLDILGREGGALRVPAARRPSGRDRALLIYTSGTTGAPKATNVTHARVLEWSYWFAGMMNAVPEDRLYNCLPMYHSIGGVVAIGSVLTQGGSIVIRRRFSASRFWDDVVGEGCTVFQYIGELCRYLAAGPPHPLEAAHRLRLCCGNGLQAEVWERFQDRFQIPRVLEFYAATEGNVSLYNCEGKRGAIGRVPAFLAGDFPMALVKVDVDTGEVLRDGDGFCIRCEADEAGEAIGRIEADSTSAARRFDGYTDPDASARKVLHDVFMGGDRWFRTGDLMRKDRSGYYYFIDRLGDTFRWKGENVSTTEVANIVATCKGVTAVAVYGVTVPGNEGRAGMAAITTDETFEFSRLRAHLAGKLPDYAQPLFVRLCRELPMTGTFKLTKGPLAREGLSPAGGTDRVWFNDRAAASFIECGASIIRQIGEGSLRL
jgi:fatty-acyl-CoA synthase